jgi:hypothetical protein
MVYGLELQQCYLHLRFSFPGLLNEASTEIEELIFARKGIRMYEICENIYADNQWRLRNLPHIIVCSFNIKLKT